MEEKFETFIEEYGCIDSPTDLRDYVVLPDQTDFPEEFVLPTQRVKNQSHIGSCVAHSLALANECCYHKNTGLDAKFSAGFIYGYRPEGYHQDKGMYIRSGLKTLAEIGNVPDYVFPYNEEVPRIKEMVSENFDELKEVAKNYKISKYAKLEGINQIKSCLMNGLGIVFSVSTYEKAFKPNSNGLIEKPEEGDTRKGTHAMFCYGWTTINGKEYLLIQNSWGIFWGQSGRAKLSVEYPIKEAWGIADDESSPIIIKPKFFWLINLFYELMKIF